PRANGAHRTFHHGEVEDGCQGNHEAQDLQRQEAPLPAHHGTHHPTSQEVSAGPPRFTGTPPMRRVLLALVLALCACAHVPPSPTAVLDEAAGRAKDAGAPARTVALAGFHALLVENQPERARALAQDALRRDASDPYGLALEEVLARRDGHPEAALDAALRLVRGAPKHPLATVAARQ